MDEAHAGRLSVAGPGISAVRQSAALRGEPATAALPEPATRATSAGMRSLRAMHTTPAACSAMPPGPTGLGTSAARVFRRDDAATVDGALPRFSIPWPPRLNPEVERMRQHSLDWARSSGIVTSDEEVARLDEPRFDRLAGYAHPDARGLRAELVGDWMIWFFRFDDWFDGPRKLIQQ